MSKENAITLIFIKDQKVAKIGRMKYRDTLVFGLNICHHTVHFIFSNPFICKKTLLNKFEKIKRKGNNKRQEKGLLTVNTRICQVTIKINRASSANGAKSFALVMVQTISNLFFQKPALGCIKASPVFSSQINIYQKKTGRFDTNRNK